MPRIRVLIADDIEIVRKGYEILFSKSSNIEICGTASDGPETLTQYQELKPDVVLLDIMMPPVNGLKICRELLAIDEEAKVLLNTAFVKEDVLTKVLASGARGLLLKDADHLEVAKAIDLVYHDGEYYNKAVLDILVRKLLKSNEESFNEYWSSQFTEREISIVKLTSEGMTAEEIGMQLNTSKRTIEVSRSAIMKKMNVRNTTEMIIHSFKIGLLDLNEKSR